MPAIELHETFDGASLDPRLRWHCEPSRWMLLRDGHNLRVEPDAPTDFWQQTHNGEAADNGHFLYLQTAGDFVMTTRVSFEPVHRYDQAGLMVRLSPECWLKTSVEYEPDGDAALGAVVTNFGYSDWSTQAYPPGAGAISLRVRREADDYYVDSSPDGEEWTQIRLAHLHQARGQAVCCGLYACSPKGPGFRADFSFLSLCAGRLE